MSTPTLQEIEKFGVASKSLAGDTVTGINLVNDAVVERNMYLVARDRPSRGATGSALNDKTFEGIITETNFTVRVAAVEQLGLYADGLKKLAAANVKGEVSAASVELDAALNGLAGTLGKQAEAQAAIGIITTAISEIGQQIVEAKKREAIKVVIEQAHPYVKQVGALVSNEFSTDTDVSLLAFNAVKSVRAQEATLKEEYGRTKASLSLEKRMALLEKIRQKHKESIAMEAFFGKVSLGTKQMVDAHQTLKDAVSKNAFSTTEVVAAVSELIGTATVLKTQLDNISQ
jgi:hypothetical protein